MTVTVFTCHTKSENTRYKQMPTLDLSHFIFFDKIVIVVLRDLLLFVFNRSLFNAIA